MIEAFVTDKNYCPDFFAQFCIPQLKLKGTMQATMESSDSTAPKGRPVSTLLLYYREKSSYGLIPCETKANVAMQKRVYIGGLPRSLTAEDLKNRFKMFGEIIQASIAKDSEDQCRGFGHITINTTTNQWTKCLSVYNHAKWKGGVMKIEDAKPDYKEKHEAEKERIKLKEQQKLEKAKKRRRTTDTDGFIAKDMTLVNDKNVDGRKGWKRGRYGRAIAVMRLQKNNGTKVRINLSAGLRRLGLMFVSSSLCSTLYITETIF